MTAGGTDIMPPSLRFVRRLLLNTPIGLSLKRFLLYHAAHRQREEGQGDSTTRWPHPAVPDCPRALYTVHS